VVRETSRPRPRFLAQPAWRNLIGTAVETCRKDLPHLLVACVVWILFGGAALAIVLAVGGFTFAASQDTFCLSCHTQPESTFLQRSTASQAADLASFYSDQATPTRCIDCHSGPGIFGRMRAELLGAHNSLAWYTGTATQPAKLTVPIQGANCLKCHKDVVQRGYVPKTTVQGLGGRRGGEEGGPDLWHERLAEWSSTSAQAATCTSCHNGHGTQGTAATGFGNTQANRAVCDACHGDLRGRERRRG
jgi:nitrate/TMAO reductase-like tetraheme cytochrome c subunit